MIKQTLLNQLSKNSNQTRTGLDGDDETKFKWYKKTVYESNTEKGASSWLTSPPLRKYGFHPYKQEFQYFNTETKI